MIGRRYGLAVATLVLVALGIEPLVGQAVPLRTPLHELPFRMGQWTGRAATIDAAVLERARPDQFLARRYVDDQARVVTLYVGYYERQASRSQVLAMCAGECQIMRTGGEEITVEGGVMAVNRVAIRQNGHAMITLYWYQQGGRVAHDPYREKVDHIRRALRQRRSEGAIVRVTAPVVTTEEEAGQRGEAFVQVLVPMLRRHFPE